MLYLDGETHILTDVSGETLIVTPPPTRPAILDPLTIIVHHRQMLNHIGGAQPGNKVVGLVWGSLVCGPLNTRTDKQLLQVLALNC